MNGSSLTERVKRVPKGCRVVLLNLVAMIVVAVLLVFAAIKMLDVYTHHGESVTVPDASGRSLAEARQMFEGVGLECIVTDSSYVKDKPLGVVLDYNPPSGQKVKKGRMVYLTINTQNIPLMDIPDVVDNSSTRQAEARIMAAGFVLEGLEYVSGERDWVYGVKYNGRVLMTGEKVPEGAPLTLMVGVGDDALLDSLNNDSLRAAAPEGTAARRPVARGSDDDSWF